MKQTVEQAVNNAILENIIEMDGDENEEWKSLLMQTRGEAPEMDEILDTLIALKRMGKIDPKATNDLVLRHFDEKNY